MEAVTGLIGNSPWWAWTLLAVVWTLYIGWLAWSDHRDREWESFREWKERQEALERITDE